MSDYLERLIDSSLDLGDSRDASAVVRPRRAALFERTTPGDASLFESSFETPQAIEQVAEHSPSFPSLQPDEQPAGGPSEERERRYAERSGQDRRAPRNGPRLPSDADTVTHPGVPHPAPTLSHGPASPVAPFAARETTGPTRSAPPQAGAPPRSPAGAPVERRDQDPARRPSSPAFEQHVESVLSRPDAVEATAPPIAGHAGQQRRDVRVRPAPSSSGEPPGHVERPRAERPGRLVEPSIRAPRTAGPSIRIEPGWAEMEARPRQEPATTIVVSIGRIEVRAPSSTPAAPARPRQPAARRGPALSLDAYLDRRNGGSR